MKPKRDIKKHEADRLVRDIRRATRRKFSAEEKIRIVLAGIPSMYSFALKHLNIFEQPGTLSSPDDNIASGWKNASLRLQDSTATDRGKSFASATAGGVEPVPSEFLIMPRVKSEQSLIM